jgi:hypothetical protein
MQERTLSQKLAELGRTGRPQEKFVEDPLASPFERISLVLPEKYVDPYVSSF